MPLDEHQLDFEGYHDESECEVCIEAQESKSCACRCGRCCEVAIVEASFRDAEREPRIAETGMPLMDDMRTGTKEQVGWMLGRKDGHCVFFDPENRLCTIYETRPLECRVFNCDGPEGEIFRDRESWVRKNLTPAHEPETVPGSGLLPILSDESPR
jgi:Fe-S-cluster containining protein